MLNSEDFYDHSPLIIVAKLADRGEYLCSASTMYRLLRSKFLLKHRRRSKRPEYGNRLETVATGPNQVWCWDISYLRTPIVGQYLKLFVAEDIYSRKIVGATVAENEDVRHAIDLIEGSLAAESISGERLRVHNDNGSPMKAYTFTAWLKSLGVVQSRSRPKVSDDNPFIESLFKTLKYSHRHPRMPFKNIDDANAWVAEFVRWYNNEHLHSSLNFVTPNERHSGKDKEILNARALVFREARDRRPERWSCAPKAWIRAGDVELATAGCRAVE